MAAKEFSYLSVSNFGAYISQKLVQNSLGMMKNPVFCLWIQPMWVEPEQVSCHQ